jgi:hypothetical protein
MSRVAEVKCYPKASSIHWRLQYWRFGNRGLRLHPSRFALPLSRWGFGWVWGSVWAGGVCKERRRAGGRGGERERGGQRDLILLHDFASLYFAAFGGAQRRTVDVAVVSCCSIVAEPPHTLRQ